MRTERRTCKPGLRARLLHGECAAVWWTPAHPSSAVCGIRGAVHPPLSPPSVDRSTLRPGQPNNCRGIFISATMSDTKPAKTRKKAAPAEAGSPAQPAPRGRPSSFSQEVADEICERMSDGESLRDICSGDNMPRRTTVYRWLEASEEFRGQYARACEARESELFDQIIEIADTPQVGTKSVSKASGIEITEGDMIEHRRLQVEARKWALGKMAPKKYGDKIQQEHSGALRVVTATELNDDQLAAIAAAGSGGATGTP